MVLWYFVSIEPIQGFLKKKKKKKKKKQNKPFQLYTKHFTTKNDFFSSDKKVG